MSVVGGCLALVAATLFLVRAWPGMMASIHPEEGPWFRLYLGDETRAEAAEGTPPPVASETCREAAELIAEEGGAPGASPSGRDAAWMRGLAKCGRDELLDGLAAAHRERLEGMLRAQCLLAAAGVALGEASPAEAAAAASEACRDAR